jgi:hypothetical protein
MLNTMYDSITGRQKSQVTKVSVKNHLNTVNNLEPAIAWLISLGGADLSDIKETLRRLQ